VPTGTVDARSKRHFREAYPSSRITTITLMSPAVFTVKNARLNLLIEEPASDFAFRLVVDRKATWKKIDCLDEKLFLGLDPGR